MLRTSLEMLDLEINAVTVPSGEEALLEFHLGSFDLLVADIRLPGISGLELLKKVKANYQDINIILVTGRSEPEILRDCEEAGADAFLLKPLDLSDFVYAVKDCLETKQRPAAISGFQKDERPGKPVENLSECLVRLRMDLGAISTLLLDKNGGIIAKAGRFPEDSTEIHLISEVLACFHAGSRLTRSLQIDKPLNYQYFSGKIYDLILAQVREDHALLVIVDPVGLTQELSDTINTIQPWIEYILAKIDPIGLDFRSENVSPKDEVELFDGGEMDENSTKIEILFQEGDSNPPQTEEVAAFWNLATEKETVDDLKKEDVLTYEQALELGLIPKEEND
jgi:CheY-like chemotaxis protein